MYGQSLRRRVNLSEFAFAPLRLSEFMLVLLMKFMNIGAQSFHSPLVPENLDSSLYPLVSPALVVFRVLIASKVCGPSVPA